MPELTKDDWIEIYYALTDKHKWVLSNIDSNDKSVGMKKWSKHLNKVILKIGSDGENMY
jgi:hypothetical protein